MSLTPELVARCQHPVDDAGPDPDAQHLDDRDYENLLDETLADMPTDQPLWLFGYGSLIWKPEIEYVEEQVALAHGWHRSFCLHMTRWRATKDRPGLMMGLDRGGRCKGVAFRLVAGDRRQQTAQLLRREMTLKPTTYRPRWLRLMTGGGPLTALAFVVNRKGSAYRGQLDDADVAGRIAGSCGHWGSGADYLYNTVSNLDAPGIHDRHLWRLQQLVAERITASKP